MAPIQSVQAAWLDEDLECIGVNNCNPETCTDTRASETSNSQDFSHNNDTTITSTSTNPMTITTFHLYCHCHCHCHCIQSRNRYSRTRYSYGNRLTYQPPTSFFLFLFAFLTYHTIPRNRFYRLAVQCSSFNVFVY